MRRLLRQTHRIGVLGLGNSGKTVFLTSLLNHLRYHRAGDFRLDGQAQLSHFQEVPLPGVARFPYEQAREALVTQGEWPEKTSDEASWVCRLRSSARYREWQLEFFDFPGERIADVEIAADRSFEAWSDALCRRFDADSAAREAAAPFFDCMRREAANGIELLAEYRLTLARLALAYRPLITPSTFMLDPQGSMASGKTPQEVAAGRFSGLAPSPGAEDGEFAPLSAPFRSRHPAIAARFASAYSRYREQVALPVFTRLRRCRRLAVLLDLATVLGGGTGRYNDTLALLERCCRLIRSAGPLGAWFHELFARLPLGVEVGIERVAFVATKLDLFAGEDRGRVRGLLEQMVEHCARRIQVPVRCFACSALESTQPDADKPRHLVARLIFDWRTGHRLASNAALQCYPVSPVPERWPESWLPNDLSFPAVFPRWPENHALAPRHLALNQVFEFLVG